jgi:predicted nucleotide-binding protein
MATRRPTASNTPQRPSITAERALLRLKEYEAQIDKLLEDNNRQETPEFKIWEQNVQLVLSAYYTSISPETQAFRRIRFDPGVYYPGQPDSELIEARREGLAHARGFLRTRIEDLSYEVAPSTTRTERIPALEATAQSNSKKVFIVHGHDVAAKSTVARLLMKVGLDPVILHEEPNKGQTIIEKFEANAEAASCAVVLLTADDVGHPRAEDGIRELRARQNVVFELGFFYGKLGRTKTIALTSGGVSHPSDISGIVYIDMGDGAWELQLARELRAAGLDVDFNKL